MTGRAALRAYAAQLTACRYVMAAQIATDEIDDPRGKSQAEARAAIWLMTRPALSISQPPLISALVRLAMDGDPGEQF
jgi:hypothetical protein